MCFTGGGECFEEEICAGTVDIGSAAFLEGVEFFVDCCAFWRIPLSIGTDSLSILEDI